MGTISSASRRDSGQDAGFPNGQQGAECPKHDATGGAAALQA
jgi:hypothetical protein